MVLVDAMGCTNGMGIGQRTAVLRNRKCHGGHGFTLATLPCLGTPGRSVRDDLDDSLDRETLDAPGAFRHGVKMCEKPWMLWVVWVCFWFHHVSSMCEVPAVFRAS